MTGTGPGSWQPDPEGRYEFRWFDGQRWTDQVSHRGQVGRAPLGGAPPQSAPPQPPAAAAPSGDGFAGITGDLVDGRFSEKEAKAIANQNSKLIRR
jgi:hypothetical protein